MSRPWARIGDTCSRFMDFLAALNQAGSTILLITHDYKLVYRYAQRICCSETAVSWPTGARCAARIGASVAQHECWSKEATRCASAIRDLVYIGVFGALWGAVEISGGSSYTF